VERDLDNIPDTSLPAILLLGNSRPCVLLQRCEQGRFLVALPGWGGRVQDVSREELYKGYAVHAAPQAYVSADTKPTQPCLWSGDALLPASRRYWERLCASMLWMLCLRSRRPTS